MKRMFFLIFIVLLMPSCATELQSSETTISTYPTNTPAQTKLEIPSPTFTSTSTPTKSLLPVTQTVTLTPNPILLTQEAIVASCSSGERGWPIKHLSTTYYTNGDWGAVACSDDGIYTKVFNSSLDSNWLIPAYPDKSISSDPAWYWKPYLWSDNGRYLYLEADCLCFIDSPWLIYASGFGISRLDLETGQFSIWLEPSDWWYTFAFTSDGNYFALSPKEFPDTIKIRDLELGDEQNLGFKNKYSILEYFFTPDFSRLVVLAEEREGDQGKNGFSVFVYYKDTDILKKVMDAESLNSTFSTDESVGPRIYISELSNDVLYLSDVYGEYSFELNIRTGELVATAK